LSRIFNRDSFLTSRVYMLVYKVVCLIMSDYLKHIILTTNPQELLYH